MANRSDYFVHPLMRAQDWQHRPQLDSVSDWWRRGGRGVCALIGIGGAGKTAIADRFLSDLLDGATTTIQPLSPPSGVLVYSFYEDDKPENFFRHLQYWLEGTSTPERPKSPTQLMFDIQQHHGLIVLDGLEVVQENCAQGGFGRLTSSSLRDLLNHVASGAVSGLAVLLTSRFPLTDLRDSRSRFFHPITIDRIDVSAGIALLKRRGVRGTDEQLATIVEHCGGHALTIDLAGGYIKAYGAGEPTIELDLGTAEELLAEAEREPDDDKRAVLIQGIRLARVARRYRESMLADDEAALALLERICLFRLGVDCETFAAIFTGSSAEKLSGKTLAQLGLKQLQANLDWLVRMRLVKESESNPEGEEHKTKRLYHSHPAVRDGFLAQVGQTVELSNRTAIFERLLDRIPRGRENLSEGFFHGFVIYDAPLADLEEAIGQAVILGRIDAALALFAWGMGGISSLGFELGLYEIGERVCRTIAQNPTISEGYEPAGIPDHVSGDFLVTWAYFLCVVGRLDESELLFRFALEKRIAERDWRNVAVGFRNLSNAVMLRGKLPEALAAAKESIKYAKRVKQTQMLGMEEGWEYRLAHHEDYLAREQLSIVHAELGNAESAAKESRDNPAGFYVISPGADDVLLARKAIRHARLALRLGNLERATIGASIHLSGSEFRHHLCLRAIVYAEIETACGRWSTARECLFVTITWATIRAVREFLCWSDLLVARRSIDRRCIALGIDLAQADPPEWMTDPPSRLLEHIALVMPEVAERQEIAYPSAEEAVRDGLGIARDCGYALLHIDLLLERARLHLLRGDAAAALADTATALDEGIDADEKTGQVELLAASDRECTYNWAIPFGLQLRAEAQLLRAAQILGSRSYRPHSRKTPAEARERIKEAKVNLHKAMTRWRRMRDPNPVHRDNCKEPGSRQMVVMRGQNLLEPEPGEGSNNFMHPDTGEEYNYRAGDTHRILSGLAQGILTPFPLEKSQATSSFEYVSAEDRPAKVFFSYAHKDEAYRDELIKHLSILQRHSLIDVWHDRRIIDGEEWAGEIDRNLEDSDIILLLVSADYLASDYCYDVEMRRALERHEAEEARVIPIILRSVDWAGAPFGKLQARPSDGKPVDQWDNQDQAFADIAKGIRRTLEMIPRN